MTAEERGSVKQLCYALLYGMGVYALSKALGVELQEAKDREREFKGALPALMTWMDKWVLHTHTHTHTQTDRHSQSPKKAPTIQCIHKHRAMFLPSGTASLHACMCVYLCQGV